AALERVRSRTMAMQRSEELLEVINIFSHQLTKLNIFFDNVSFGVNDQADDFKFWLSSAGQPHPIQIQVPYYNNPAPNRVVEAQKKGLKFFADILTAEENKLWVQHLIAHSELKVLPDNVKNYLLTSPGFARSTFILKNINLYIGNFKNIAYTEEENNIFKRFAQAFEQSYIRFLDLQKAEAQAREAQIELGLERVRARAMAMQKSDELSELVDTVFKELTKLDFALTWCIINIIDESSLSNTVWAANPEINKPPESYHMLFEDYPFHHAMMKGWKERRTKDVYVLEGQEKKVYDEYLFNETEFRKIPEAAQAASRAMEKYVVSFSFSNFGGLQTVGDVPLSDANLDILSRFGKVFDLTYTRFNDLKLAEAQAREAQIQLAMERVRARTMAMQKSDELSEAANLLFLQVQSLGMPAWSAGYCIWDDDKKAITLSMSSEGVLQPSLRMPLTEDPSLIHFLEAHQRGETFFVEEVGGEALKTHYTYLRTLPGVKETLDDIEKAGFPVPTFQIFHCAYFSKGFLLFITYEPVLEAHDIFKRFANVFEQTYTRFLDLQKAEAQARESKIEAALERVRSRTMAMHRSDELAEVATVLFEQMSLLDNRPDRFNIRIANEAEGVFEFWATDQEGHLVNKFFRAEFDKSPVVLQMYNSWKAKEKILIQDLYGDQLSEWVHYIKDVLRVPFDLKHLKEHRFLSSIFFSHGMIGITTNDPPHPETLQLIERFAKVFEQTYTRFLDLQKAEAQAREAKIETALEKVRASTMAMQHSDHLSETAFVLFNQFKELGEAPERIFIATFDEEQEGIIDIWGTNQGGNQLNKLIKVSADEPTVISKIIAAWKEKRKSVVIDLSGDELKQYISFLKSTGMPVAEGIMEERRVQTIGCFSKGVIGVTTPEPQSAESVQLLERFAGVFDLTYTRFLDLQKAEAQAREAKIEAALERVRSRTMAMQRSAELAEVATVLFQQVKALGVPQWVCGFGIWEIGDKEFTWFPGSPDGEILAPCKIPLTEHPVFISFNESRKRGDELFVYEKEGEFQADHYRYMMSLPGMRELLQNMLDAGLSFPTFQIDHLANFSHGNLVFITYEHFPEMHDVFKRFAKVFDQTYTRFLDLQKSEAQAREAIKQASVDRVRAEIASMRTTSDLERITPLIWNELKTLGVPFIRCGVFIIDEARQQVHTFLSTPDGKANASFTSAISTVSIIAEALPYWRRKEMYKAHWDEAMFIEQTKHLVEQGAVSSTNTYLTENRPKNLYLHLLPFLQGILYVGNETPLNDDELQLVQNLADAFAIAYARYEDFNKLELAKEQIENTLVDLKQTQAQLVQSEKMASLGELTAGIAHEIQNPLNFVNNFSEVNKELLAEMNEEIEKGNYEEVQAIAKDVTDNEEKISHHGKRADAIVKGMLQHSRTSSGIKEPADINALADEYLRLAYHGLRAKDKSFNATMKTEYDEKVGKINIVPQDVGRSVLNLITNAFYAVAEKKKQNAEGYEPTVTVTTKRINGKVEIRVADNGNGIPQKVLDKIFQPFFTTKPTGHGTGLGLSLSYDIIKAHGGEINVETKEGEGSEFFIFLPANN
ncbi:MAG TPA: ATP-binding protein, partial [Chitinophagaceae bacterium]|nr:ATP-binding protein [Chitinophagaceae bacterium]